MTEQEELDAAFRRFAEGLPADIPLYVVAMHTWGSFHGWATDPLSREDAEAFVADPPDCWAPRPQDQLVIFELTREDS